MSMNRSQKASPPDGREETFSHSTQRLRQLSALSGLALFLALAFPLSIAAQTNCVPPVSGLVSWWRAEGNAVDSVGGNNGTLVGGVNFGLGEVGEGFVLPGRSGITVGNAANLQLQSFTIEAWIRRNNASMISTPDDTGSGYFFAFGAGGYGIGMCDSGEIYHPKLGSMRFLRRMPR